MSSSNFDTISITLARQKIEVDHRISLRSYYLIAENLLKQASIFREEKNNIDLYVILLRFCSLISETIPFHRDYHVLDQKEKTIFKRKLLSVLNELESLKPEVRQKFDEIKKKGHKPQGNTPTMTSDSEASFTGFNREKQAMPSPQRYPNSEVSEMRRLSISIPLPHPRHSSSQSNLRLRSSSQNFSTFSPVIEIQPGRSPSAHPIEDLGILEDAKCESRSTSQKPPISSDEMKAADATPSYSRSSSSSSSCVCAVCLDAPIEGACVPCGHMVGCISCLNAIKDKGWGCPVCRTKIDLVLRLYAV